MPVHPDLQKRHYRLNVSVLALEAGVSRNAIYTNHSAILDDLAAAVRRQLKKPERLGSAEAKIKELSQVVRQQKADNRRLLTHNAALVARLNKNQRQLRKHATFLKDLCNSPNGLENHEVVLGQIDEQRRTLARVLQEMETLQSRAHET